MSPWLAWTLSAAAVITAVYVLFNKLVLPLARMITRTEQIIPHLDEMAQAFRGVDRPFDVLKEIIAELRSNGGSTARDLLNRLEQGVNDLAAADTRIERRLDRAVDHLEEVTNTILEAVLRNNPKEAGRDPV